MARWEFITTQVGMIVDGRYCADDRKTLPLNRELNPGNCLTHGDGDLVDDPSAEAPCLCYEEDDTVVICTTEAIDSAG